MAEGYAINDEVILEMLVDDLMDNYDFTEKKATAWVKEHGSAVIDDMWDAYTRYLEDFHTD
jgi:hypothetical protein